MIKVKIKDARNPQILFLATFLILGIGTRDWTVRPEFVALTIGTCLLTQGIADHLQHQLTQQYPIQTSLANGLNPGANSSPDQNLNPTQGTWRSALITALGLGLLLRANSPTTMILAGVCAIASKFLFRHQGKHWFNPANFGIIMALTFTPDAWVSPGQWGTDWWYLLLFLGAGGLVLRQVGRWDTSVIFLATYGGLEAIRSAWLGWSWDVYGHQLMSGSLLLFALFMLTDPRSIPDAPQGRGIWAMGLAGLTLILQHQFFLPTALFWALFCLSPLTLLLDQIWSAPRFVWQLPRLETLSGDSSGS
ncbi:MAG: Na+-transporting NADH:ubiquinone oxidoreductase, subunit NqrB [Oscillatoriales cyanobacterium RM2_1_1]|nr:Na+-transporting NADH:ubiquinone oxidoreductase, subunit NqrB [Oscillatoriales cyanobacterium RM2_1_1]